LTLARAAHVLELTHRLSKPAPRVVRGRMPKRKGKKPKPEQ
jgi:hypothetical protein